MEDLLNDSDNRIVDLRIDENTITEKFWDGTETAPRSIDEIPSMIEQFSESDADKAIEIATDELGFYPDMEKAALAAMRWKNEQFKQFLIKLKLQSTTYHVFELIDNKIKELNNEKI